MKKSNVFLIITICILFVAVDVSQGQIMQGGEAKSAINDLRNNKGEKITNLRSINNLNLPAVNKSEIDALKEKNGIGMGIRHQFAFPFEVNINLKKVSTIDTLVDGLLYRYAISSEGALSMILIFGEYYVPNGSRLFLFNSDMTDVKGAFTSNNNKPSKILPMSPISGSQIYIEYFEPFYSDFQGSLIITKVSHDFTGFGQKEKAKDGPGYSADCQVDVTCSPEIDNWLKEKDAVVEIMINGKYHCTGSLINNTKQDGTPYVLTAHHCIIDSIEAASSVFIFNYENYIDDGIVFCENPASHYNASIEKSISGADLVATWWETDFTLLKLTKKPLPSYKAYYAGWNREESHQPGAVGIHHPRGDSKKIATSDLAPDFGICMSSSQYFGDTSLYYKNEFFNYIKWVQTENGFGAMQDKSSGSPLFNSKKQIIGQLIGVCNPIFDYKLCSFLMAGVDQQSHYGKLNRSWNGGATPETRLKDWLDPLNLNPIELDGLGICEDNSHIEILDTVFGGEVSIIQKPGTITALNKIEPSGTAIYEAGMSVLLEKNFHAQQGSSFSAKIKNFDCVVTCDTISLNRATVPQELTQGDPFCIEVKNAKSCNVGFYYGGGPVGWQLCYQTEGVISNNNICFPEWSEVYNICAQSQISWIVITIESDCEIFTYGTGISLPSSKSSFSTSLNSAPKEDFYYSIFPNPSVGTFTIKLDSDSAPYSVEITSVDGKMVYYQKNIESRTISINLDKNIPKGTYIVRLTSDKFSSSKMIVVN